MNDVVALIPTWLTARHAVGCADSIRKYYPDMPIFFVDDKNTEDDKTSWWQINIIKENKEDTAYDEDSSKLIGYPNSAYILREHKGWETKGHANAITDAMKLIHAKWVVLMGADCRLIRENIIEDMLKDTDDNICGVGDDWSRDGPPNLAKWLCLFRGDLYHKYNLDFHADDTLEKGLDAGQPMFDDLVKKGYKLKLMDLTGFYIHLKNQKNDDWEKYY